MSEMYSYKSFHHPLIEAIGDADWAGSESDEDCGAFLSILCSIRFLGPSKSTSVTSIEEPSEGSCRITSESCAATPTGISSGATSPVVISTSSGVASTTFSAVGSELSSRGTNGVSIEEFFGD